VAKTVAGMLIREIAACLLYESPLRYERDHAATALRAMIPEEPRAVEPPGATFGDGGAISAPKPTTPRAWIGDEQRCPLSRRSNLAVILRVSLHTAELCDRTGLKEVGRRLRAIGAKAQGERPDAVDDGEQTHTRLDLLGC
jgi:hypothetical protein